MSNKAQISAGLNGSDQRYLPRWEVKNRVLFYLEHDAKTYEGTSRDLSACGICINTNPILPLRDKIKLIIYLTAHMCFEIEGRIVWSKTADNQMQIGILFDNATQKVQDLILMYAFEFNKTKLVNHWFKGWS